MAGRIPIYRRVGEALRMRPAKADRGICTSCHRMPSRALPSLTGWSCGFDSPSPALRKSNFIHYFRLTAPPIAALCRLLWWQQELTTRSRRVRQAAVQRRELGIEQLSDRDVPSVTARHVFPKLPYPRSARLVGKELHAQVQQVGVRERGHVSRDVAGQGRPPQDVRDPDRHQVRSRQRIDVSVDAVGDDLVCAARSRSATRSARLSATRLGGMQPGRLVARPAQYQKGDIVPGVLTSDQGLHDRGADALGRPRCHGLA